MVSRIGPLSVLVSDAFLLNMAEVSSAVVGLFLVGIFFFVESGFSRSAAARDVMEPCFRHTREELTWAILLAFASGFLSISAGVLSAFDVDKLDPTGAPSTSATPER